MNVQSSENSGLNLPQPVMETSGPRAPETAPQSMPNPEQAAFQGQRDPANVNRSGPPAMAVPVSALSLPPAPLGGSTAVPQTAAATSVGAPAAADDNDLIEKEWVNKAKEIVERTRENPYQQSKELNLFKADYMKKRYNKTLKLSE